MGNSNTIELRLTVKDDGSVVIKQFAGQGVKNLQQIEKQSESMTSKMGSGLSALRAHWLAFTAVTAGAVIVMKESIKAAADLEEVQTRFNIIFRSQIDLAKKWATSLQEGYFLSEREAKQYLSSVNNLLISMGYATDQAGKFSLEIVKLAADMGTFYSLPAADVMRDIESALVGNYRAMKDYGIVLNDAIVDEYALTMGLAKNKDELSTGQRAWAAYNIIIRNAEKAIGATSRETGGYSSQIKQFQTNVENLKVALGEGLLPALTNIVKQVNEWIKANDTLINQKMPAFIKGMGGALTETTEEKFIRQIDNYEKLLAQAQKHVGKQDIFEKLFGIDTTKSDLRYVEELTAKLNKLYQDYWAWEEKTSHPAAPAAPPGDLGIKPPKIGITPQFREDYKKLHEQITSRIEELSLDEKNFKIWQLNEWYQESVKTYQAAGKETVALTQLYWLERAEIDREYTEKLRQEEEKRAQEAAQYAEQWRSLEHAISSDLMSESERRKAAIVWEFEDRAAQLDLFLKKGILTEETYTQAMIDATDAREKLLKEAEKQHDSFVDDLKDAFTGWASNMSSTLNDVLWDSNSTFGDIATSFGKMITQMIIQTQILKPLMKELFGGEGESGGGWFGSLFSGGGGNEAPLSGMGGMGGIGGILTGLIGSIFARGGVMYRGRIYPMAGGAVITGPTIFPMAEGYGLMGEKGFEAVMPLARTPSGDLGVKTSGEGGRRTVVNGPMVQFNITTPDADSFRRTQGQIMAEAALAVQRGMRNN